jgi:hypothetical protein
LQDPPTRAEWHFCAMGKDMLGGLENRVRALQNFHEK